MAEYEKGTGGNGRPQGITNTELKTEYGDFDPADYPNMQHKERTGAPGINFEGMFYQFDYYSEDGQCYACCIPDTCTGEVRYTCGNLPGEVNG